MSITRINELLPPSDKIEDLNDQTLELNGRTNQAQFDKNEIESLYSGSGMWRKFRRDISMSASTGASAWYNWSHIKAESGYAIWRFDGAIRYAQNSVNNLYFDNAIMSNKGSATSEDITAFDNVQVYDGSSYTDRTAEAATAGGTAFDLLAATTNYVYIGHSATFSGINFNFGTRGSNNTLVFQYSNGSGSWVTILTTQDLLVDATGNFIRDGNVTFTAPTPWTTDTVNSVADKYWIRVSTTSTPVTTATALSILPYNSVPSLLALTSADLTAESWKFCEYSIPGTGARIYGTFRNIGSSSYEGNFYVTGTSSVANKENFFRFNHTVKGDFQDASYVESGSGLHVSRADGVAPLILKEEAGGPVLDLSGTAAASKSIQAPFIPIKWNGTTYYLPTYQ